MPIGACSNTSSNRVCASYWSDEGSSLNAVTLAHPSSLQEFSADSGVDQSRDHHEYAVSLKWMAERSGTVYRRPFRAVTLCTMAMRSDCKHYESRTYGGGE